MSKRFARGIWWVKRDFRLADNDALLEAMEQCEQITALFIIEPSLCKTPETSQFHYHAWQQASQHLAIELNRRGAQLHVVCGEVVDTFESIRLNCGFYALFSHQETGSDITYQRDQRLLYWAENHGIHWHQAHQNGVVRALTDRSRRQVVIRERLFQTRPKAAPVAVPGWRITCLGPRLIDQWPAFDSLSGRPADSRILPSETQEVTEACAQAVWESFLGNRGVGYSGGISSPNTAFDAGSRLSAHLAWGTISLRRVFHETWQREKELKGLTDSQSIQWRKSLRAFQSRLHWHDHFIQRLESAPSMEFDALNPAYRRIRYGDNEQLLAAWAAGRTGLPIVDACMRCLAATGFLNFRMRAMVVSAGCFGLAQSWQALHYPLARVFLDYEPGIHFSQIQMQAGIVGINTLRIYSPHKQLLDQDPQAVFVKRWIPELREFNATQIAQYNHRTLGDYPEPITDIDANTRIIRDQVYAIRKSDAGREASAEVLLKHGSRLSGNDRNRRKRAPAANSAVGKSTRKLFNDNQMTFDFDDHE